MKLCTSLIKFLNTLLNSVVTVTKQQHKEKNDEFLYVLWNLQKETKMKFFVFWKPLEILAFVN